MAQREAGRPVPFARLVMSGLALLSLAAAAVHLSAATDHREHRLIFAFFIVSALVQLAWAGLVVQRPTSRLLLVGAAVNAAFVGIWLLSRTAGVPLVAGATAPEEIGLKDTVCVLFEVLVVSGVALLAVMPAVARTARVSADAATRGITAVGVVVVLLAVPASLSAHSHGAGHDHVDAALASQTGDPESLPHTHNPSAPARSRPGVPQAVDAHNHQGSDAGPDATSADTSTSASAAGHVHDASSTGPHPHGQAPTDAAGVGGHTHDGAPDGAPGPTTAHVHDAATCQPTPAQQAAADKLVADTKAALARWADQNKAIADGYIPYPPVPAGWAQHYVNFGSLDDGRIMDPSHPESLLYAATDAGYRPISALYILPHADSKIPDNLGCLAHWHNHPELFLSRPGENGSPPMLHVFVVPMRGGPFAHEPDPESVRNLWTPWRMLVNPWWRDGCEGAPWLPGDPYQVIPSCAGWKDGHPADH